MSHRFGGATCVWWCHVCLVVSRVFGDVTYVWWRHVCLAMSRMVGDVTYGWWCHVCLVMSRMFGGATCVWCHVFLVVPRVFGDVTYVWLCHVCLAMSRVFGDGMLIHIHMLSASASMKFKMSLAMSCVWRRQAYLGMWNWCCHVCLVIVTNKGSELNSFLMMSQCLVICRRTFSNVT